MIRVGPLCRRALSTAASPPTAVVMMNMGGPSSLTGEKDGVQHFLTNLFTDPEIIPLGPLQKYLVRAPRRNLFVFVLP